MVPGICTYRCYAISAYVWVVPGICTYTGVMLSLHVHDVRVVDSLVELF